MEDSVGLELEVQGQKFTTNCENPLDSPSGILQESMDSRHICILFYNFVW